MPLALVAVFAVGLSSCGKEGQIATTTNGAATPVNEVDAMINDYEKVANEYIRVASRLKGGDMSVTVRYIDLDAQVREWPPKLRRVSEKMIPQQAQRVVDISARTAMYLQK